MFLQLLPGVRENRCSFCACSLYAIFPAKWCHFVRFIANCMQEREIIDASQHLQHERVIWKIRQKSNHRISVDETSAREAIAMSPVCLLFHDGQGG